MDAHEIVMHEVDRHRMPVVLGFFEKPLVSRVNRRIDMRMVKFWRSTRLVEI